MIGNIDEAYSLAGGMSHNLHDKGIGSLVINDDHVLSANAVEGVDMEADTRNGELFVKLRVLPGYKFKDPLHLCFGVLSKEMAQRINMDIETAEDSEVSLQAHCLFPNAVDVLHAMEARIKVGPNAKYTYNEVHWHGDRGLVRVIPNAKIFLAEGAQLTNSFSLVQGAVGRMAFDYDIECGPNSICHMLAKVYGKFDDNIIIKERAHLLGANSRALLETRMVIRDNAYTEIVNEIVGEGDGSRGHMDCIEIISGRNAKAKAMPVAIVMNDKAKVTHEAAIGSIDSEQLNLLLSRGLTEEQATEVIVNGLLK